MHIIAYIGGYRTDAVTQRGFGVEPTRNGREQEQAGPGSNTSSNKAAENCEKCAIDARN
jgi:hypothetical protein